MPVDEREAAILGCPSYVWRFGQERRLALVDHYAPLQDKTVLDIGCGLGMYTERLRRFSQRVYGVDLELARLREAKLRLPNLAIAQAEGLPYPDNTFEVVLLHEVIEHVQDDHRAIEEAYRVAKPQGRIVIFAPNRLYPFETHGIYWQGRYRFGNIPLVNYLPQCLRGRLVPHARAYTTGDLHSLFRTLPHRLVVHSQIYPGYDSLAARKPRLASLLRRLTYSLERTPFRVLGLSHFLVVEKC